MGICQNPAMQHADRPKISTKIGNARGSLSFPGDINHIAVNERELGCKRGPPAPPQGAADWQMPGPCSTKKSPAAKRAGLSLGFCCGQLLTDEQGHLVVARIDDDDLVLCHHVAEGAQAWNAFDDLIGERYHLDRAGNFGAEGEPYADIG
jgi:hypothetical protein